MTAHKYRKDHTNYAGITGMNSELNLIQTLLSHLKTELEELITKVITKTNTSLKGRQLFKSVALNTCLNETG